MKITRLAILITLTFSVLKSQATEFNASLLDSGNLSNVDLTAFSREGYVAPGNYILDIWLNDQPVREQYPVRVVPVAGLDAAVICVTTDMVAMLGLKDKIIHGLKPVTGIPDGQCLELRSADSQVRYSAENQRLTFIIPQAWMRYQDPDWVPPSRWSDGVTAGLLDYSLMVNRYMPQQGETSTSYSLYGTAGFNLGAWRLRSDYQYSRFDSGQGASQSDFYLPQTYLFRALPALRSKLTLGQTYLSSAIFDSFRFAGLTLASDERMLPPSLQGYAPKISGIANSNAQVTVSQNGRILYQTRVSPGPFELPDLSQNISGNLDVSVRESDGSVRTWQVNTASVPFMARQGQVRYKVAAGRPLYGGTHNNSTVSPDFLLGRPPGEHLTTRRCMAASLPPPATTSPRRSGSARIWGCWALCLRTSPAQMRGCRMGRSSPVTATVSTMPKRLIKPAVPWRSSDTASRTAIFCPCRSTCSVGPLTAAMHGMKNRATP